MTITGPSTIPTPAPAASAPASSQTSQVQTAAAATGTTSAGFSFEGFNSPRPVPQTTPMVSRALQQPRPLLTSHLEPPILSHSTLRLPNLRRPPQVQLQVLSASKPPAQTPDQTANNLHADASLRSHGKRKWYLQQTSRVVRLMICESPS